MAGDNSEFKVYSSWVYNEEQECYTDPHSGCKFSTKEGQFCFVDKEEEIVPKEECYTNLETGEKSSGKAKLFNCLENSANDFVVPKQEASEKEILPLRLYTGHGQRMHRQKAIELNVVNKRCPECGEVGQVTCFSASFRRWALKRVTEKELNQKCNGCGELGHNCLDCGMTVVTNNLAPIFASRKRKTAQCSGCGDAGHNRRTCPKGL